MVLAVGVLLLVAGCDKQPETPVTKKVVSKKIDISGEKAPDVKTAEKKVPLTTEKKSKGVKKAEAKETPPKASTPSTKITPKTDTLAYVYDSKGKKDPFETIFRKRETAEVGKEGQDQKKKRVPLTPLEKIALSQLRLVAVMLAPSGSKAMVEDASGKGYIITNGTYIGKNSGRVINILLDKVVVEEEVEDVLGKLVVRKTEMKLQKTPGE